MKKGRSRGSGPVRAIQAGLAERRPDGAQFCG